MHQTMQLDKVKVIQSAVELGCCQKIHEYSLTYPSHVATESTLATGLINVLIPDARRLSPSCLTSRSVPGGSP